MEGREIILLGYNVSEENDSIKELLIAHCEVIFVVLYSLKSCLIKQRNYLLTQKTKAFKYERFYDKKSTFFHESYLNLYDIVFKKKKNRHLCLS